MEFIKSYLVLPVSKETEAHISNYLRHAHYPHAVDQKRMKILVFNMSDQQFCKLLESDRPITVHYSEGEPPLFYQDLFDRVEARIRANYSDYDTERLRNCMRVANGTSISDYVTRRRLYRGLRGLQP